MEVLRPKSTKQHAVELVVREPQSTAKPAAFEILRDDVDLPRTEKPAQRPHPHRQRNHP